MPCGYSSRKHTPIVSDAQRKAMTVARYSPEKATGAAKQMAKSMPKAELSRHLKESKGKNLPEYVVEERVSKRLRKVFSK